MALHPYPDNPRRLAATLTFQDRGCDPATAAAAARALIPFDDGLQPGRAVEKSIRKLSKEFAKRVKHAQPAEIEGLAAKTLYEMNHLALFASPAEIHYAERFRQARVALPKEGRAS